MYNNLAESGISAALRQRWQYERTWQNSNIPDGGLYYTEEVVVVAVMVIVVVVVVTAATALQSFGTFCLHRSKTIFLVFLCFSS